jgi:nitroreductase
MELHQCLVSRRTVHKFRPGEVPAAIVDKAVEAAHWAPNHKLTFPWRFTFAGPQARKVFTETGIALKEQKGGPLSAEAKASIERKFMTPGVLIAVSCIVSPDAARAREDYAAVACAIQNLMLSFWDSGFGSMWGTGAVTRHPKAYETLRIDPAKEEIVGFLYVGVPETVPPAPARPPARDFVREVG